MTMDMPEFQELMAKFRIDLSKTRAKVYKAYSQKLSADEEAASLAAGQAALAEYSTILGSLDDERREMAQEKCDEDVEQMREWVDELTARQR